VCMCVLEHYFESKYSDVFRQEFSNTYTNNKARSKPTIHQIVIKLGTKSSDMGGRLSSRIWWTFLAAVEYYVGSCK
jgi:hypothetical protein